MTDATPGETVGPAIILVQPQLGENIGAVCRAMWNCGLSDLRLVDPRDGWPSEKARAMASGANVPVDNARVFATTAEATADLQRIYATTARPRDMVKRVTPPREAAAEVKSLIVGGQRCGILFGSERFGLVNEDIVRAEAIIQVPLNPAFTSLNLGQAALLVCYEYYLTQLGPEKPELLEKGREPATADQVDGLLEHLDRELDSAEYYREPNLRPTMQRNLHNIFRRAQLTDQEVRSLRGVVARLAAWRGRWPW